MAAATVEARRGQYTYSLPSCGAANVEEQQQATATRSSVAASAAWKEEEKESRRREPLLGQHSSAATSEVAFHLQFMFNLIVFLKAGFTMTDST